MTRPLSFSQLAKHLPPRTIGYPWTLAFSTSKHGMSIKTLYRIMQGQDSPVLLIIKDSDGQVRLCQSMIELRTFLNVNGSWGGCLA